MTAASDAVDAGSESRRACAARPVAAWVAYLGAAAFVVTAAWSGRLARSVTVATLPPERLDTGVAIAGCLCLLPLAAFARDLLGRQRALGRIGSLAMLAGALLWVTGNMLQLGGHRAADIMATHGNPIETVDTIMVTVDTVDDAFALAAFAVLGVALLAFAGAAVGEPIGRRAV